MKNYELVNLQLDEQNMNNDIMSQTEQDIYFEADELNDIAFVNSRKRLYWCFRLYQRWRRDRRR